MITANELRIGNYVNLGEHSHVEVCKLEEGTTSFEPIELTPEILEAVGFEKHLDKGSPFYFLSGIRYNAKTNTITILRSCDKAGESQQGLCGTSIGDEIKIQYLHQLQNLIFALTGNELEITL